LALVRAIAGILPISASAHLQMLAQLHGPMDQPAVALAAEAGMALGMGLYFWRDLSGMAMGLWRLGKRRPDAGSRLLMLVALATIPALVGDWALTKFAPITVGTTGIAIALLVFGLFLLIADRLGVTINRIEHLGPVTALALGLLQVAGAITGVSRVGLVITAARLLGYERADSGRLALLLAIPLLVADAIKAGCEVTRHATLVLSGDVLLTIAVAALAALVTCAALMGWLRHHTFTPFAVWRIVVGGGLFSSLMLH
jgi:undecaprenyl-diphosphatase